MREERRDVQSFHRPGLVRTDKRARFPKIIDIWNIQEVEDFEGAWLNYVHSIRSWQSDK